MGTNAVTKEEALDTLAEERRTEMQAEVDQRVSDEEFEEERRKQLVVCQERAKAIIEERQTLLPTFIEVLGQVGEQALQLRNLRDEHAHLTAQARKLDGTTETQWPRAFAIDPKEREILRQALIVLQSVGGVI